MPFLWLTLCGNHDIIQMVLNGDVGIYSILTSLCTISAKDAVHATGVTAVVSGSFFCFFDSPFSIVSFPFIGALDRLLARVAVVFGLGVLLVSYKFGLYS